MYKKTALVMPTVRERALRTGLAAVMACSMGATCLAIPQMAWAEDGTITITAKDNQNATYKVYELFKADIAAAPEGAAANIDGIATHISWAVTGAAYDRVHAFLLDEGMSETDAANPQKAAEFIGQHIADGPWDADAATTPKTPAAQSFANNLAQVLATSGATAADYTAGSAFTSEEGYYLFVTDDASVGTYEAGTAAAWVPLGGKTSQIAEKTALPTLDKSVLEGSTSSYGHAADSNRDEDLHYRLTANMPSNIGAYKTYHLKFTDSLSDGLALSNGDTSSVAVFADDVDITAQLPSGAITYSDNVLTVDIANVLALSDITVDADTQFRVDYLAHLTDDAVMGASGNENAFKIDYTNNPITLEEGTSKDITTRTYTYVLNLEKLDKATGDALQGAKVTVQAKSSGKYVQADGTLGDEAYEFQTDADGCFTVKGIDSGTYLLHETAAPEKYELWDADIELTLTPTFDQETGELKELAASATGGEATRTNDGDIVTNVSTVDAKTGVVKLQTSDDKMIDIPITGMSGVMGIASLAGGAVAIGLVGLLSARRDPAPKQRQAR